MTGPHTIILEEEGLVNLVSLLFLIYSSSRDH